MPPVVECRKVSKSFVLRTNRQSLLKDRARGSAAHLPPRDAEVFWELHRHFR